MSSYERYPMKHKGKVVVTLTEDDRAGLLKAVGQKDDPYLAYGEDVVIRLEATIRAREADLAEMKNRLEVEAIFVERYVEADTSFELCQELARRLRTYVIIGPRKNAGPAICLTDRQVAALAEWANEGDRKGGTTAWGVRFSAVMEIARTVRDLSESYKPPGRQAVEHLLKPLPGLVCRVCGGPGGKCSHEEQA